MGTTCDHERVPQGYEHLNEPPRQCPDCQAWLDQQYEESFDGEDESQWFWLEEVPAPSPTDQGAS